MPLPQTLMMVVEAVDSEQEELKRQAAVLRRDMGAELAGAHPPTHTCIPPSYDGGVPCLGGSSSMDKGSELFSGLLHTAEFSLLWI